MLHSRDFAVIFSPSCHVSKVFSRMLRSGSGISSGSLMSLSDGNHIPRVGLGCYKLAGKDVKHSVAAAISCGYRLFDTAAYYGNEKDVGSALRESGLHREDFYVVTKLWHADHGLNESKAAIEKSLENLGLSYIDLYLVHGPSAGQNIPSWMGILEMKDRGYIRSAGVSNFNVHHLQPIKDMGLEMPVVNQIELHPWLQQREVVKFCEANGIAMMAFCPLARASWASADRKGGLQGICQKYGRSPSQVLLRWAIQKNFIVIPKSSQLRHIKENMDLFDFELDDATVSLLNDLDCGLRVSNNSILSPWLG